MAIIPERDADGVTLSRTKITKAGWHYQEHALEITTSTTDGFYNKDKDGNDLGFITYTMFDVNDTVTTVEADAVKTCITWMPTYDYEIIGASMYQAVAPTSDYRVYVTGVPDYPAPSGNASFMQGGCNFRRMGVGKVIDINGRVPKLMQYNNPIPNTNKFEFVVKHDAGYQHTIQVIVDLYKA